MKKLFFSIVILVLSTQFSQGFERFIPLELFTGGKIRNDTEIKFTKANLVFGEKKKKKPVRNYYRKRCEKCGQIEKGHICPTIDIDTNKINSVLDFFKHLF